MDLQLNNATKGKYRLINNIYQFNTDNVPDSDTIIVYKNQRFDDVPTQSTIILK